MIFYKLFQKIEMSLSECGICYENLVLEKSSPCNHECCSECWVKSLAKKHMCPFCRGEISSVTNIVMPNVPQFFGNFAFGNPSSFSFGNSSSFSFGPIFGSIQQPFKEKVYNPETKRYVTIGGAAHNKMINGIKTYDPEVWVKNEATGRHIKRNGLTIKKLQKQGVVFV